VFRCDSVPAKDIANCLRDTCRRIINEKKAISETNTTTTTTTNNLLLKRPNFLPDITSKFNVKFKSLSCHDASQLTNSNKQYEIDNNHDQFDEEPKKSIKCRYLGSTLVQKPSGMEVLNEANEKIYMQALDDYKQRVKKINNKQNKSNFKIKSNFIYDDQDQEDANEEYDYDNMFSFNLLDLNGENKELGTQVEVSISPTTISIRNQTNVNNSEDLILECRVRYLSFMGISIDARFAIVYYYEFLEFSF